MRYVSSQYRSSGVKKIYDPFDDTLHDRHDDILHDYSFDHDENRWILWSPIKRRAFDNMHRYIEST